MNRDMHAGAVPPSAHGVVIIAYFFPPTGGVSVQRLLRTAEYLPRYGWRPTIVAPERSGHFLQDVDGLREVPDWLRVIRTPCPEPRKVRRVVGVPQLSQVGPARAARSVPQLDAPARRLVRRAVEVARAAMFPDEQVGWLPFAVAATVRAAREGGIDAILSSSSPATAHLAAAIASRIMGLPWVADFRDPWADNVLSGSRSTFQRVLRAEFERAFVMSAAQLTFPTAGLADLYRARYPGRASRVRVVPNGYDLDEEIADVPKDPRRFTVVYTGTLDRPRELSDFLSGLALFAREEPDRAADVRVRFLGSVLGECVGLLDEAMASPVIGGMVERVGWVPRSVALGHVRAADACLLLLGAGPDMGLFVGGKLYDYLGRDVQVLAVVPPEGDAARVLRDLDWGVIVSPGPRSVAEGLGAIMAAKPSRSVADPERRYERARLTAQFAYALDSATGVTRGSRSGRGEWSGC